MNKDDVIKNIENQFSMLEETFDEYERIWGMGDFGVALAGYGFITASLDYTLEKLTKLNENFGLDGMAPMLVKYMEYRLRYNKIGRQIVSKLIEVESG